MPADQPRSIGDILGTFRDADLRRAVAGAAAAVQSGGLRLVDPAELERDEQRRREVDAAERSRRAHAAHVARLRAAGIPEKHVQVLAGLGGAAYDQGKEVARLVAAWRASQHHTLVLAGTFGAGKSLAACWLLDQGPRRPYPHPDGYDAAVWPVRLRPRYVHASRLARLSMYGRAGEMTELEELERCAILVIDEVGGADVGRESSWAIRLDSIVSHRADCALDTILTTNLFTEEFRQLYGERVLDRMRGDGACWHEFGGASLRTSEPWEPDASERGRAG